MSAKHCCGYGADFAVTCIICLPMPPCLLPAYGHHIRK
jgi:hypothetical protein